MRQSQEIGAPVRAPQRIRAAIWLPILLAAANGPAQQNPEPRPGKGGKQPRYPLVEEILRNPGLVKDRYKADPSLPRGRTLRGKPVDPNRRRTEGIQPALCPVCNRAYWRHVQGYVCAPAETPERRVHRASYRQVTCPNCNNAFRAPLPNRIGQFGGLDHDFFHHRIGREAVSSDVWMCVRCGFARFHWEFEEAVSKEVRDFVAEALTYQTLDRLVGLVRTSQRTYREIIGGSKLTEQQKQGGLSAQQKKKLDAMRFEMASYISLTDVPDWRKYENAVSLYENAQTPDILMAQLHRGMAFACRMLVCGPVDEVLLSKAVRSVTRKLIDDPDEPETNALNLLSRAESLVRASRRVSLLTRTRYRRNRLTGPEMLVLQINIAGYSDRLGDFDKAHEALRAASTLAERVGQGPDMIRRLRRIVDERTRLLTRERQATRQAIRHMRRALATGQYAAQQKSLPAAERAKYDLQYEMAARTYLMAEMYRRIAQPRRAAPWLAAAWSMCQDYGRLRKWVLDRAQQPELRHVGIEKDDPERKVVRLVLREAGREGVDLDEALASLRKAQPVTPGLIGKAAPIRVQPMQFSGPPQDAPDALDRIGKALLAYRDARKRWPDDLDELKRVGLLTAETSGGFRDPKSGAAFIYSMPKTSDPTEPIVFSSKHRLCPWILRADGKVLSTNPNP